MVSLSPVGLSAAPVANQLSVLAVYKERLCKSYCVGSSVQPQIAVVYTNEPPELIGGVVFVPIVAVITVVSPNCSCKANTQLFTERYKVAFTGQTAVPATVTITSNGRTQSPYNVMCGRSSCCEISDSITVSIA